MKQLARWTLNAVTALSLLLCVATIVAWSVGIFELMTEGRTAVAIARGGQYTCELSLDGFSVRRVRSFAQPREGPVDGAEGEWRDPVTGTAYTGSDLDKQWLRQWKERKGELLWFSLDETRPCIRYDGAGRVVCWGIETRMIIPYWSIILVTSALPIRALWSRQRRRRRTARGLCAVCGYDLRATPGRCPECGAVAARALRGY